MKKLWKTMAASLAVLSLGLALVSSAAGMPQEKMETKSGEKKEKKSSDKKAKAEKTTSEASLYHRLGGKKAITVVVDDFVANCASDTRINSFFAKTAADPKQLKKFKGLLVDQICEASGGPCKYKGKTMKESHKGMGVKEEHFNALVEDLIKALDKNKVPEKEKNELLGLLGPMKADIVE
jgi:hemoglobin